MIGSNWSGLTIVKSPIDPLCWPDYDETTLTVSPTTLAGATVSVDSTTNLMNFDAVTVHSQETGNVVVTYSHSTT